MRPCAATCLAFALCTVGSAWMASLATAQTTKPTGPTDGKLIATIETEHGTMRAELFPDKASRTVESFVELSKQGFYDGLTFHRIIKGFMIQGGCPKGDGTGGPPDGRKLPFEGRAEVKNTRGSLAMARTADPNSAGCQFFIVHQDAPHLDTRPNRPGYTVFGRLMDEESLATLDQLAATPVRQSPTGEPSMPTQTVKIQSIRITAE